jgi:hypothetical protein
MVERGGELRLGEEAIAEALVLRELGRDQLERHLAVQSQILGEVDDAHAAPAEEGLDQVAGELGADAWIGGARAVHRRSVRLRVR